MSKKLFSHHQTRGQRGDTLVEVLLAMVILSAVIVGASILMNSGLRSSINAVEHTQVRNVIASQGELLRYLRDGYQAGSDDFNSAQWRKIVNQGNQYVATAAPTDVEACAPGPGRKAFYLVATFLDVSQAPRIDLVEYDGTSNDTAPHAVPGRGVWVEGVASTGASPAYIDFHLRGCWIGLGSSINQHVNSVVRLYVPEGS
ncbi:prepilin-type N-terminal cleavage/methylation domain-containing protein [Candidatus Saccharibacteria bacterium]|nr:prepilin-type N-terminal cleavage/methylation domain-containing protein [Candidatus Saccharibacteria bacterium]